ncbi:ABC transporter ATP-binding protein [Anaerolineales bacterium HSG24]|nr:ABC transporter ATP-binding protein [Anaerolineales bacterium HSG24]
MTKNYANGLTDLLHTNHLTKNYNTEATSLQIIDDISFKVMTGEFVCIVGPSGCGKTTLLRLLAGLHPPDTGEIFLNNQPLLGPSAEIGVVFQKASLMPWRTVFDNVRLPLQVHQLPAKVIKQRIDDALELVGLTEFAHHYPRQLSGGMEQRVAIARALAYQPKILMLDEPFGALDALNRERLNEELLRVWRISGQTVLMVTHDIHEAVFLSDRVLVLSQRPAKLIQNIPIPLPRPRNITIRYETEFSKLAYHVRQAIQ